jgi:putative MFS transporter
LYWLVTVLVSLAFTGNGVALAAISFSLPGIRREWDLSPLELGYVPLAVAVGQVGGALFWGWLADRWGRRRAFAGTIAMAAAATGLAGLAPNTVLLMLLLGAAGVGVAGVAPVAASLLSEFAPPRVRGQLMAWTQVWWAGGWCLAAAGGAALTANLGWRWILAIGGSPLALALLSWRMTPESPRFLLAHGKQAEAEALAADLERRYGVHVPLPRQQPADDRSSALRDLLELWSPLFRRRTLTLWLAWLSMVAAFNGPVNWLPALLSASGGDEALAARLSLIVGLFMLPAGLLCVALIERAGRRPLLVISLALAAAGTLGLMASGSELVIILAGGALAAGLLAAWPVVLLYSAELYPTRLRGTAAGWAGAISRLGGVVAPLLLGALLSSGPGGLGLALAIFAGGLLLAALLVIAFGEETTGRTLEELSG